MQSDYFATHAHSKFSWLDGLGDIKQMVARAVELGQPALALTDHGNMAGAVQLYRECKKAGIAPYPGEEFYVVQDVHNEATRGTRWHLGMLALDLTGYKALTLLSTLSWRADHFYKKPLIDFADLAFLHDEGYADHIAVTTGCYSSVVVDEWKDPAKSERMIQMLQRWFPHLYVEIQNHSIVWPDGTSDLDIAQALYGFAQTHGLPVIVGGDSHYVMPEDQAAHDLMKDICYHGNGEDYSFSGGPYHLLDAEEALSKFPTYMHDAIEDGHSDLLDKHALSIPPLDTYKFHVPSMGEARPYVALRRLVLLAMQERGWDVEQRYIDRAVHELKTIDTMRMSNYFLLVKRYVTDWCRDEGIIVNTRGSANGSLVCFLLGITNVDPIKWHTSFERFISVDRMKPPDIDIDVDFRGRRRLIDHLRRIFPTMTQVGTYAQIGITEQEDDLGGGEDKGSVFVQYMAAKRRKVPNFDGKVAREDRPALNALAALPAYKSMGTNAAGFILPADSLRIDDYLPLARVISSDTTVTQMTKDDVESLGYMKLDVLGLRALQTLNGTLTRIGRQPNDWDWIPLDDKDACALLRSGNCVGLFQYEGYSSQMGGKELRIKSTLDTILGLALYRPALMNGGQKDLYLSNRGKAKAKQQRLPALFDVVVKDTAGVPLFQEQILEMLKAIGMQFQDYNDLMTAIKASNGNISNAAGTFQRIMPVFYDLCETAGLSDEETDQTWGAVIGFTEYGFNRAHATSYGLMSYHSAFLKAHYPLEYMASLLDVWAGEKKEPLYTREARNLGISIVRPDVNFSGASWDIDPTRKNALRKGLVCIKGIGEAVAETIVANRPDGGYASMDEFVTVNPARPVTGGKDWIKKRTLVGVCNILHEQGALRSLPDVT